MRKDESAANGQRLRTETAPDRSSHKFGGDESCCGRKMKGGPTDVSHSIKSGMAVPGMRGKTSTVD